MSDMTGSGSSLMSRGRHTGWLPGRLDRQYAPFPVRYRSSPSTLPDTALGAALQEVRAAAAACVGGGRGVRIRAD